MVIGLALDLWSKNWAFRSLGLYGRRKLIPRVLEFQTMMNDGALFGIGSGRTMLFLAASVLALVLVLWMFGQSSPRQRLLHVALGAILAGALGNMYDRIFVRLVELPDARGARRYYVKTPSGDGRGVILREYAPPPARPPREFPLSALPADHQAVGHVRDFIKIPTKVFGQRDLWPWVFNVADMLLVGGVGILAIRLWRERRVSARKQTELDLKADRA